MIVELKKEYIRLISHLDAIQCGIFNPEITFPKIKKFLKNVVQVIKEKEHFADVLYAQHCLIEFSNYIKAHPLTRVAPAFKQLLNADQLQYANYVKDDLIETLQLGLSEN